MKGKMYGYVRVSTAQQHQDRQYIAIKEYGVPEKNIFSDKQSGKDFDRPGYKKAVRTLRKNDTLVIKSIDRLGRNFDDLLDQWRYITVEKQAGIIVLDMPMLNCGLDDQLMGRAIGQIMLIVLSYLAENERITTKQRQAEGIAAAKLRGVQFGRRAKEIPKEFEDMKTMWEQGVCSASAAARQLGVDFHTFKKWVDSSRQPGFQKGCPGKGKIASPASKKDETEPVP